MKSRAKLVKNKKQRQAMRNAGRLAAEVLEMIEEHVVPGVSTLELDTLCYDFMIKNKAIPACLGYRGFPKTLCTSVNSVACHGIPNETEILKSGDIINIDVTVIKDDYHGDTSKMFYVGEVSDNAKALCEASRQAMLIGMQAIKPGLDIGVIGTAIEEYIDTTPYSISIEYSGHGIGKGFHEFPPILSFKNKYGVIMQPGMTFTVEPIINEGIPETEERGDDLWTIYTADNKLSAQWEHTILVTKRGYDVLTKRRGEII